MQCMHGVDFDSVLSVLLVLGRVELPSSVCSYGISSFFGPGLCAQSSGKAAENLKGSTLLLPAVCLWLLGFTWGWGYLWMIT